jgi:hypothetical protein
MTCKNKKCYKTEEYNWSVIENKVSPYSLVQNNRMFPTPVWAKVAAVVGLLLFCYCAVVSVL